MKNKERYIFFLTVVAVAALVLFLLVGLFGSSLSFDVSGYGSGLGLLPMEMDEGFIEENPGLLQCVRIAGSGYTVFVPSQAVVSNEAVKGNEGGILYMVNTMPSDKIYDEDALVDIFSSGIASIPFTKKRLEAGEWVEGFLGNYRAGYGVYNMKVTVSIRRVTYAVFAYIVPVSDTSCAVIMTATEDGGKIAGAHGLLMQMGKSLRSYEDAHESVVEGMKNEFYGEDGTETGTQDAFLESENIQFPVESSENATQDTFSEGKNTIGYLIDGEMPEGKVLVQENINITGSGEQAFILFSWDGGAKPYELHLYYPDGEEAYYMEEYNVGDRLCFSLSGFGSGIYKLRGYSGDTLGKISVEMYDHEGYFEKFLSGE